MKIGICAHPADVAGFPEPSFDFIEANVQGFLIPEKCDADFEPLALTVRSSPRPLIAANCFIPADLKVTGPSVDHGRFERYADTAFWRANAVGITMPVFGSGGARQLPDGWPAAEGFEQYVSALRLWRKNIESPWWSMHSTELNAI